LQSEVGSIAIGKRANLLLTQKMQNLAFVPYNFGADSHQRVLLGSDWY
jgi:imidazolonepropionase